VVLMLDELRATFLFEAFSGEQLRWLSDRAEVVAFPAGAPVFAEGESVQSLWVLLAGELRFTRTVGGREIILETSDQPGSWGGWLPMFDDVPMTLAAGVLRDSRLLRIPKDAVVHMLARGFPIATHLLAGLYGGVQNFEALSRQQEKLAALGKLAAGLAHELNNPAAAAGRAASRLRETLRERDDRALALGGRLDPDEAAFLAASAREAAASAGATTPPAPLDPLARGDLEDELAGWLEERGVADGWELAPTLADAGLDRAALDRLAGRIAAAALPDALAWLGATLAAAALAGEVEESAARISTLVGAIKEYSYLDRAPEQEVDLHAGLENTLTILGHKLRGIAVAREYDRGLPRVCAHGSELNQVWTNLLDNAIDAVTEAHGGDGRGRITIRTAREGDRALVEIGDNGPGIPPAIQGRIFEPFFTTKGVGQGTGLGLDTSYRIVVGQHKGDLRVESRPGDTRFQVRLPVGAPGEGEGG
jgi:signal transduction histidine kinase